MRKFLIIVIILGGAFWFTKEFLKDKPLSQVTPSTIMQITSSAFANNGTIPTIFTCSGQDINPPLSFSRIPGETRSLALIMDDPDTTRGTFTHWVVYNMSPNATGIPQGSTPVGTVAKNGAGTKRYIGPCPPTGEHRYYFKLYALDTTLTSDSVASKEQLVEFMTGHILEQAELMGRFKKSE